VRAAFWQVAKDDSGRVRRGLALVGAPNSVPIHGSKATAVGRACWQTGQRGNRAGQSARHCRDVIAYSPRGSV